MEGPPKTSSRTIILLVVAATVVIVASILSSTLVNLRTDPELKDGIRCMMAQMAEHRQASRNAHLAIAEKVHADYQGGTITPIAGGTDKACAAFMERQSQP